MHVRREKGLNRGTRESFDEIFSLSSLLLFFFFYFFLSFSVLCTLTLCVLCTVQSRYRLQSRSRHPSIRHSAHLSPFTSGRYLQLTLTSPKKLSSLKASHTKFRTLYITFSSHFIPPYTTNYKL